MRAQAPPEFRDRIPDDFRVVAPDFHVVGLLHEMMHALQAIEAPERFRRAHELYRSEKDYPFEDVEFAAAWNRESRLLMEAIRSREDAATRDLVRRFLDVRDERRARARLTGDVLDFEREIEWLEGLGKYAEIRFHEIASAREGLELRNRYPGGLPHWRMEFARLDGHLGGVEGDFRFYLSGMAMGRLLDRLDPEWKGHALGGGARLDELLRAAVAPAAAMPAQELPPSAGDGERDELATLRGPHPRLFLGDERLADLRRRHEKDEVLRAYVSDVLEQADRCLALPPLEYRKIGPRLLHVSRECLRRVTLLAFAWRWTGDEKYARAAERDLLTVCAFDDWNPSHFLDTAEMSHAVGIGYDWLFPTLSEETRGTIRAGLVRLGLEPGLACYPREGSRGAWWARSEFNWNQVCNGGLLVGALAVAETDPRLARATVRGALESLPVALGSYEPDGVWMEGPGYWDYATRYTAYGLDALRTALGTDSGLSRRAGLERTGWFPIETAGPTGLFFNFADAGERSARHPSPAVFWLARTYDLPGLADAEHALLASGRSGRATPHHVIWYVPPSEGDGAAAADSLDRRFRGSVEVAVFRSARDDARALFVAAKAGYNRVNHGHLDLGTFVFDALGVRWAVDLGSDDYNLPGYWDGKRGGRRWTYFRLGSASHNVVTLAGENQDPEGAASFTFFRSGPDGGRVGIDFTRAYAERSTRAVRGIALVSGRRAVLVQDEFDLVSPCEVAWGMTTRAEIAVEGDGRVARLRESGEELVARILAPAKGVRFVVASAERDAPEKRNAGVRRLVARMPEGAGAVRLAILLVPSRGDGESVEAPPVVPLAEW
jgi:hypothetical protein